MKDSTEIIVPPGQPLVELVREFDAPPERVFRAMTEPDLVMQWMGPRDLTNEADVWDARSGGSWRYVARRDGEEHWFRGCFHEVTAPRRIVQTFSYEGYADAVSLEILELEPLDGGRTRLHSRSVCESVESRDRFVASGMEHGIREGYLQLDELLAGTAG